MNDRRALRVDVPAASMSSGKVVQSQSGLHPTLADGLAVQRVEAADLSEYDRSDV